MNTATQTIELKRGHNAGGQQPGYFARRDVWDWLFAVLVLAGTASADLRISAPFRQLCEANAHTLEHVAPQV